MRGEGLVNNKVKKIISIMLLTTMTFGQAIMADTLTDKKSELQEQQGEYNNIMSKQDEIVSKIEKLDTQIVELMLLVEKNEQRQSVIQEEIKVKTEEVDKQIEEIEKEQEAFSQRLRAMYIANSDNTLLQILLQSESLGDLISRANAVKKVSEHNTEIIASLKDKRDELEIAKKELENKEFEIEKIIAENNESLQKLDEQKAEQAVLFDELKIQEEMFASKIRTLESEIDDIEEQRRQEELRRQEEERRRQEEANRPKPPTTENNGGGNVDYGSGIGSEIVNYAMNFLGVPYVWGGSTPSGFDCSGFTQYVYRQFGIYISRTTYTQMYDGKRISRSELIPGDMVFFGSYNAPHHVGIYVGGNQYIHAPYTGTVIQVNQMTRGDFVYGVRPF